MPATWIQEPASYPPPGWTRTPLYLELCAMKQHVASLTDDNIQLRGTVTDLRETLSHLSSEVGKMKRAFGALSNLVDAEVDSCRGESSKLWLEVTQAKESGVLMQQAIDKVEHGLAQQRAHDDARARASDEWIERTVLELRDDVERRWQSWMEDSRQRTLDAQALARDLEQQSNEMQRCAACGVGRCVAPTLPPLCFSRFRPSSPIYTPRLPPLPLPTRTNHTRKFALGPLVGGGVRRGMVCVCVRRGWWVGVRSGRGGGCYLCAAQLSALDPPHTVPPIASRLF